MSVIIKSNQTATKNLGNLFGIKGNLDYSLLLDFNQGIYNQKIDGVIKKLALTDAITLSRSTQATYLDENNNLKIAGVNEARLHYDKRSGKKGLLIESSRQEFLTNTLSPATQTVTLTHSTLDVYALAVKGTGSATISGVISAMSDTLTATESVPILVRTDGNGAATVTVSGSLQAFSLQKITALTSSSVHTFAPQGVTTIAAEVVRLSDNIFSQLLSGKTACTIVMHIKEMPRPKGAETYASRNNVFALLNTSSNNAGIYVYRQTGNAVTIEAKFLDGASNNPLKSIKKTIANSNYDHTYVLTYDASGANAILARNGEVYEATGAYELTPNLLNIGSSSNYLTGSGLNGIVTMLAIYPYKMTYEQAQALSLSLI